MLPPRFHPLIAGIAAASMVLSACGGSDDPAEVQGEPDLAAPTEEGVRVEPPATTGDELPAEADASPEALASDDVAQLAPPDEPTVVALDLSDPGNRQIRVMDPPLEPVGTSSGAATQRAQWRLLEMGFWVQEASGDYGITTTQAVMAFQKYHGLETDGVLGPITAAAMSEVTERPHGRSTTGTLVEVDKNKQLVFIIRDGVTQWILNTSTGSEIPYEEVDQNSPDEVQTGDSVTRTGLFDVYREREEGWWEGDLGEIYRPKYFDYGIALHGSYKVPDYPASHGCVRLSIPAMDWIWDNDIVPKGTPVWVHGEIREEFRYEPDADTADG